LLNRDLTHRFFSLHPLAVGQYTRHYYRTYSQSAERTPRAPDHPGKKEL
jgi:hypothetical protein